MAKNGKTEPYVGVDVGGTKIMAALIEPSGKVVARSRLATPREGSAEHTVAVIEQAIDDVLAAKKIKAKHVAAIGLAIPGVVDSGAGRVVLTPNMNLSGVQVVAPLKKRFGARVVLGNDVSLGTLGEQWLGAAKTADSAAGIFWGTGIGGGLIQDGRLVRGSREAAGEVGHIVMQVGGPLCGCGNHGCLEALAGRTAIERDIREEIAAGHETVMTDLLKPGKSVIKSKMLRRALAASDEVVTRIMTKAAETIGHACVSVRHLLDPDLIVMGGGVIEACGDFAMPIIRRIVSTDAMADREDLVRVVESKLGDDAVVLGAVALARQGGARG